MLKEHVELSALREKIHDEEMRHERREDIRTAVQQVFSEIYDVDIGDNAERREFARTERFNVQLRQIIRDGGAWLFPRMVAVAVAVVLSKLLGEKALELFDKIKW